MRIPSTSARDSGMLEAVDGAGGEGVVTDYRDQPVIAAWAHVPSFGWGMAVKQDLREAYASVDFQRILVIGLSLATIVGVTLAAFVVARTISTPIRAAVQIARQVAAGDLRATVAASSDDETGALLTAIQTRRGR